MRIGLLTLAMASALGSASSYAIEPATLSQLGDGIDLTYTVLDNKQDDWRTFRASISLTNDSGVALPASGWAIYFSHIRMINQLDTQALKVTHINGDIFKIEPTAQFAELAAGENLTFEFDAANWQAAKSDVMPNWYFVSEHEGQTVTALIKSTSNRVNGAVPVKPDEELAFVTDFSQEKQWKRYGSAAITDFYDPFSANDRYQRNQDLSVIADIKGIVPTPAELTLGTNAVNLDSEWVVVYDNEYQDQAMFLANALNLNAVDWTPQTEKVIKVGWGKVTLNGSDAWTEAYNLNIDSNTNVISIKAADPAGAFYAAQSLLQLQDGNQIQDAQVVDAPRFGYRGLSVDAVRNFRSKDSMLQLIDQMATFKLNKLHFRLSDDEAWRIEIPGLPELTEVGAKRCHDLSETNCMLPFLGAGPDGTPESNGYYTIAEYQEILAYADERNIEVIPELDLPGHAHAPIKAMEARYHKYAATEPAKAEEYLLTDFADTTQYLSVQMFTDNAVNVCMESTYNFVDKVISELTQVHNTVQPLQRFHFGGDEIAGAWKDSPKCAEFFANNSDGVTSVDDLSQYFVQRVARIAAQYDLNLGGWEDGLMHNGKVYDRAALPNTSVSGNAWQNIWEWGVADRAFNLANNGFDVVYNQASHFYFDHPYEPDPSERGYYWAPRFTDTRKSFGFMPKDLFANADFTRAGAPLTKQDVLDAATVKTLLRPEKVLGLQGSVWSETIRTEEQFEGMAFPRLIALAERAWHEASWEAEDATGKVVDNAARNADYNRFANLLAQKILPNLEADGIAFNLPVPGGVIEAGVLKVNSPFPGLAVEYSVDNGATWQAYNAAQAPAVSAGVLIRTVSGQRSSRTAQVN